LPVDCSRARNASSLKTAGTAGPRIPLSGAVSMKRYQKDVIDLHPDLFLF
jgi:hypothetical protein